MILDGGYELKEPLALEQASAIFKVRILGSNGQEATVNFYEADLAQAEEQLSFWQTLREWPHPNVSTPLAAGYRWLGEVGVVYVVLPIPDEKLSVVLRERRLTAIEAAEVARSIMSALGHVHACGLAHGGISPETVLAVGESIQISTESVRRQGAELLISPQEARYLAPESDRANNTAAADMWCLGATLFEILSQRRYTAGGQEQIRALPFSLLLHKCLAENPDLRCNLTEALAIFAQGPKAVPPPPPPPVPEPVAEVPAAEVPAVDAPPPVEPAAQAGLPTAEPANSVPEAIVSEAPAEAVKSTDPAAPAEAVSAEAKPAPAANYTGAAARVAAAEEARNATVAGDAFKKAQSASFGTNSIHSAPLPSEPRHKPAEMKRKPVGAKTRQVGLTGDSATLGTLGLDSGKDSTGGALAEVPKDPRSWVKPKAHGWQLAVGAGVVLVMLFAVIFLVVLPRAQAPDEPAGPVQSAPASAGAKGNAWQTKTLAPSGEAKPANKPEAGARTAAPRATPPQPATGAAQSDNPNNNWRVVLYSYQYRQDAQRRLVLLGRSHPTLDAHLFVPAAHGPFMVVMGGPLSKDAADQLKTQAIPLGLPRALLQVRRFYGNKPSQEGSR